MKYMNVKGPTLKTSIRQGEGRRQEDQHLKVCLSVRLSVLSCLVLSALSLSLPLSLALSLSGVLCSALLCSGLSLSLPLSLALSLVWCALLCSALLCSGLSLSLSLPSFCLPFVQHPSRNKVSLYGISTTMHCSSEAVHSPQKCNHKSRPSPEKFRTQPVHH